MIVVGKISLADHPSMPSLQVGSVAGQTVVVGRHYDEGTLGFFVPDGYILSDKLLDEMWLRGRLAGKDKNRVKARVMGGIASAGVFYGSRYWLEKDGVRTYIDSPSWNPSWKEGDDITDQLGLERK